MVRAWALWFFTQSPRRKETDCQLTLEESAPGARARNSNIMQEGNPCRCLKSTQTEASLKKTMVVHLRSSALGERQENKHPSNNCQQETQAKKSRRATRSSPAHPTNSNDHDDGQPNATSSDSSTPPMMGTKNSAFGSRRRVTNDPPPAAAKEEDREELQQASGNKRRCSLRNTNQLRLDRTSLQYRRLEELFFDESPRRRGPTTLQYGSYELTRVSQSPNIWVVDDFLNAAELQYLLRATEKYRFQRSYVDQIDDCCGGDGGKGSHYDDSHRTSTFVSFAKQQDATISRIETKAADLIGCYSSQTVEALQLVRYKRGQFFGVHHDMADYNEETGEVALPPKSLHCKRRIVTLFCYLNGVPAGGATHFPVPNVRVEPQPGRAVLFSNILASGQPDPRTVHAGEPVQQGEKFGLNIWICEE